MRGLELRAAEQAGQRMESTMRYTISVETDPNPDDVANIRDGLTQHGLPATGVPGFHPIAVMARDDAATLVGGAVGTVNWNWLHINLVWVSEALRHTGLGTQLLTEIERAGVARGCTQAHLDTFSFQARPFYERIGYTLFGTLDEYPPGEKRYFLRKVLRA